MVARDKKTRMVAEKPSSVLEFVSSLTGDQFLKIEESLGEGYVRLKVAEAERRQARHDVKCVENAALELLRNSRDANAGVIFIATSRDDNLRHLTVIDDGCGIPLQFHERVFEPRVTSRVADVIFDRHGVHGRGMALFSIRATTALTRLVFSAPGRGSVFKVMADTERLPERKDQSSVPRVSFRNGRVHAMKGPHNIPRLALEFALDHPEIDLYLGSPTEILATLRALSGPLRHKYRLGEVMVSPDFKIWQAAGAAQDARELAEVARHRLALDVSERNAHRVIKGEVQAVAPVASVATSNAMIRVPRAQATPAIARMAADDIDALAEAVEYAAAQLAQKYCLLIQGKATVRLAGGRLLITVDLADQEAL